MPMFCTQCGQRNVDDANFCESCGTPLTSSSGSQRAAPLPPVSSQEAHGPRGRGSSVSSTKDFFGKKEGNLISGTVCIVASVIVFIWVQSHAPGNIGAALTSGWVLKEWAYYSFVAFVLLVAIYGIVNLARALRSKQIADH